VIQIAQFIIGEQFKNEFQITQFVLFFYFKLVNLKLIFSLSISHLADESFSLYVKVLIQNLSCNLKVNQIQNFFFIEKC